MPTIGADREEQVVEALVERQAAGGLGLQLRGAERLARSLGSVQRSDSSTKM